MAPISDLLSMVRRRLDSLLSGRLDSASAAPAANSPRVPLALRPLAPDSPISKPAMPDIDSSAIDDGGPDSGTTGADRKGVLVVDPTSDSLRPTGEYATLGDACRAAHNGDVIEVRAPAALCASGRSTWPA